MKIGIRTRGLELTRDLHEHVERRLRFGMARFGARLRRVYVQLVDVNGPRGGLDTECTLRVELAHGSEVVIRELHRDAFSAVARASDRLSHAVSRRLERLNARRRGRRGVAERPWGAYAAGA